MKQTFKKSIVILGCAAVAGGLLLTGPQAVAQVAVTETSTTTTSGTLSAFDPAAGVVTVRTETSAAPMTYRYTKETTIVDETGAVLEPTVLATGVPVEVYYAPTEPRAVSRIVVRRATMAPATPIVTERETTTTTTTTED